MKNRKRTKQRIRRWGLSLAVFGVLVLPFNWRGLVRDAAYLALGARQPASAAAALDNRLFAPPAAPSSAPAALATPEPDSLREDSTRLDLPAQAEVAATPAIAMTDPPGKQKGGGTVATVKMDTGNRLKTGIATINRSGKSENIAAALKEELPVTFTDTKDPQVLILHTHTTEGYMTYDAGYYNPGDRDRTKNHQKNVCAVGEAIRLTLAQAGIVAIHDTTVHDSPQYSGAYNRSAATAQKILEKHPTIRVVLDVHRDAVMDRGAVVKPTATVAGKQAAQMMLITGTVSTDALPHPHWQKNLALSTQLQAALDRVSPDLMRPLNTVASRYNQHLSPGWLLVEVGAEGNTVAEAVYAGQILAETLVGLLD